MPEGHTIHRYARRHRRLLRGGPVRAASPQGRFSDGAAVLDGREVTDVTAYGKHLFYRWSGDATLHVHLGLYGAFRELTGEPPPPTPGTRLELRRADITIRLAGPTACELIDPATEDAILRRLGPDPLHPRADGDVVRAALRRRTIPVGAALLDQSIVAGVGNAFRAEALFVCGIHPDTPARELTDDDIACVWEQVTRMLRAGLKSGRIVTVDPAEIGVSRRAMRPDDWRYVYRRTGLPCRRCGTPIAQWTLAARTMYACPSCQPRRGSA